jgi:p70 ribosomal S6 kinase
MCVLTRRAKIRHPFVISLKFAFQTDSKVVTLVKAWITVMGTNERCYLVQVYLVMDYQSGGELFSYLREQGTFTEVGPIRDLKTTLLFPTSCVGLCQQETTRFYLAEMILALEHLHALGIIHR